MAEKEKPAALEINLEKIKREATEKREENEAFRQRIKRLKSPEFDALIHETASDVYTRIDCTRCGNCCKVLQPAIVEEEVPRLALKKNCSSEEFIDNFLELAETKDHFVMRKSPCVFLSELKCTIYTDRPSSCADYPHLLKEDQKFRMRRVLNHYGSCPIIYHVIEILKEKIS